MSATTHFFLGANSGRGFQSLFDRFCDPEDHYDLAVLKGGPGGGKSTLIRRIGQAMEERGETVEYFCCSGDPDSLDGVSFPRLRTAIVDGTAPHIIEPRYPGAVDRYVDLGQFCDFEAVKAARAEVIRLNRVCAAAYRRAYQALGAARQLYDSACALVGEGMDREKLLRRGEGIAGRELRGRGTGGKDDYRFLGSVTCRGGVWRFDSVEALCPRIYQMQDTWGLAAPVLEQLRSAARRRGFRAVACPDPEHMDRIQHLLLPELGLAFVTSREGMVCDGPVYRRIRVDAMVPADHYKHHRARLRFIRRMTASLREEGVAALKEAKAAHDQLEALYRPAMDLAGLDEVTACELRRLEQR